MTITTTMTTIDDEDEDDDDDETMTMTMTARTLIYAWFLCSGFASEGTDSADASPILIMLPSSLQGLIQPTCASLDLLVFE